jgi:hypothetical protein
MLPIVGEKRWRGDEMILSQREASEIFCWIGNIELCLEDIQRAVTNFFSEGSIENRRYMLELIISQRQLWKDRPVDIIQKLINTTIEKMEGK